MGIMKDLMKQSDEFLQQIWSQAVMAADKDPKSITGLNVVLTTAPKISSTGSRFRFPAHFMVDRVLKTNLYQ